MPYVIRVRQAPDGSGSNDPARHFLRHLHRDGGKLEPGNIYRVVLAQELFVDKIVIGCILYSLFGFVAGLGGDKFIGSYGEGMVKAVFLTFG